LSKPPKITFRSPKLQTLIKPVGYFNNNFGKTRRLFVKKMLKFFSFISKDIGTQIDDAHAHPCERQD